MNSVSSCSLKIADSHSHLHFEEYGADLDAVLERARKVGVDRFLLVGIDPADSERAVAQAAVIEGCFAAVGIHPQNAGKISPAEVERLGNFKDAVAIGETGFDLHWTPETELQQEELFRAHIDLARKLGKPLVIHDREAHEQTLRVLDDTDGWSLGGVMHCFSGDASMARYVVERGFYVSIPGVVTFKNAGILRDALEHVPLERLLIETDAPFLSPVPYRGKRNEPAYLVYIIEKIAEVKRSTPADVAGYTYENFKRLFLSGEL